MTVGWTPRASRSTHLDSKAPQITTTEVVPSPATTSCKHGVHHGACARWVKGEPEGAEPVGAVCLARATTAGSVGRGARGQTSHICMDDKGTCIMYTCYASLQ